MNPARTARVRLAVGSAAVLAAAVLGPLAASAVEPTPTATPSEDATEAAGDAAEKAAEAAAEAAEKAAEDVDDAAEDADEPKPDKTPKPEKAPKPPKLDKNPNHPGNGHAYGTVDRTPGVGLARGHAKGPDHPSAGAPGQDPGKSPGKSAEMRGQGHRTSDGQGHVQGNGRGHRFDEPAPLPPDAAS